MKRKSLFYLFILWMSSFLFSQAPVKTYLDYARFRYNSQQVMLEMYYMLIPTSLTEDQQIGLVFALFDAKTDSQLAAQKLRIDVKAAGQTAQVGKVGLLRSILPEGSYRLAMITRDLKQNVDLDTVVYDFKTMSFDQKRITLSDVEICSNIIPNSPRKESNFYKNTMEVIPNPSRIFSLPQQPNLYYYVEVYNVQKASLPNTKLHFQVVIADKEGHIRSKRMYKRPVHYQSLVERGALNISRLETGLYTLIFAVTDSVQNYSVYRRANFYVINPNVVAVTEQQEENRLFLQSEFSSMPESMVDQLWEEAKYIASPEEVKVFQSLKNLEGKRLFLFRFWRKRERKDPDVRTNYYQRVQYANEHFQYGQTEGWKSDRGRVYIIYGPPDQIERFPNSPNENPYEIWYYYNIEGGVEFDFVDFSGFGDFKLVNSTKRGEIYDPNWRNYIRKDYIR